MKLLQYHRMYYKKRWQFYYWQHHFNKCMKYGRVEIAGNLYVLDSFEFTTESAVTKGEALYLA